MLQVDERIPIKKEQVSSYLVYNIVSLGKMAEKAEPFSWKSVEDERESNIRKFRHLENLRLFWMMLNTVFACL